MEWKYLQIIIAILVGIISASYRFYLYRQIKKKDPDPKIDAVHFVGYKPLALAFFIYIASVVTEIRFVNFDDQLTLNPQVKELARNLNTLYSEFDNDNDKIRFSILDDKVNKLTEFTKYALNNDKVLTIEKTPNEFLASAHKIFKFADNDSKIYATSYVKPSDWWKKGVDRDEYLDANNNFIKNKNGGITRIHLFDDTSEYNFFKDIMKLEFENKIETYYIYTKDIPEGYDLKEDVIIVNNRLAGRLILDEKRNPKKILYYAAKDRIKECIDTFNKLQKMATKFENK